jgi:hypothetical protein
MVWLVGSFAGVAIAKSFYNHYFLQPLPALCIITGLVLLRLLVGARGKEVRAGAPSMAVLLFIALGMLGAAGAVAKDTLKPAMHTHAPGVGWLKDTPAQIAAAIRPVLDRTPGATIFVFDYEPIIYGLVHVAPPTRYAFPAFYIDASGSAMAGIDAVRVVAGVLAKKPLFIIVSRTMRGLVKPRNDAVYDRVDRTLAEHYKAWKEFPQAIVYRRRSP